MNRNFLKNIQLQVARDTAAYAIIAGRFHLVWVAIVVGPFCILAAYLAFPYLGKWSYQTFHCACFLCFLISALGISAWLAQRLRATRPRAFISILLLVSSAIGAFLCLIFGDFYWAFTRGYFLD